MSRLRFLLSVIPLCLAGCAGITEPMGVKDPFAIVQPFQGVERNERILSVVTQAPAIVVRPIYGLGAENAEALRKRVLTVLRTHDVPAITESSGTGLRRSVPCTPRMVLLIASHRWPQSPRGQANSSQLDRYLVFVTQVVGDSVERI